jgi:hypothetical protein
MVADFQIHALPFSAKAASPSLSPLGDKEFLMASADGPAGEYSEQLPFRLDVIVGGVQKGGTTSLAGILAAHRSLAAPSRKELHVFDNEKLDWRNPALSDYGKFFAKRTAGQLRFEVTPIYLFWPPSPIRIREHNPSAKLIFLFRDPIERAFSHWRMETRRNAETLSFSAAIREGRERMKRDFPLDTPWRVFSYVERGFYADQIERLFAVFPREQILLLRSQDLMDHPATTMSTIAHFIGIEPFGSTDGRIDHVSPEDGYQIAKSDVAYLRDVFRKDCERFATVSGLRIDDWLTMR